MAKLDTSQAIDKGCVLIVEAGHLLSCNDVTICKGMLIYHHYYQKAKNEYKSFFYLFANAALSLSIQICEEIINPEDVLRVFKSLGMHGKEEVAQEKLEEKLKLLQYDMYRVVFDRPYREATTKVVEDEFCRETAHKYVFPYLKLFADIPEVHDNLISIQTWTLQLLFTFYHCQRCTCYDALELALAALSLAFYQFKIDLKHVKIITKETKISVNEIKVRNAMDDIVMVSDVSTENLNYSLFE